jgi:hypothetical protein
MLRFVEPTRPTWSLPRLDLLFRNSNPHSPDAQARDETDVPVNREHLAMVTPEPTERRIKTWRVIST